MLDGYKAIAAHIAAKYELSYDASTVRGWKNRRALPVSHALRKVFIAPAVFDRWFEKTILQRS